VGGNTYQYYDPPFQHIEGDWDNPQKVHIFHNNYTTDKVANFTYGYLKEALAKDRPFFIGVAPITPHSQVGKDAGPPLPAHKYNNTRPDAKVPRADNFNPENVHISTVFRFHRLFAFLDCANDDVEIRCKH